MFRSLNTLIVLPLVFLVACGANESSNLVVRTCEMACSDIEIDTCGDEATMCLDDCLLTVSGRTEDCGRCLAEQSFSTVEGGGEAGQYCGYRIADPTDGTCDDFCSP